MDMDKWVLKERYNNTKETYGYVEECWFGENVAPILEKVDGKWMVWGYNGIGPILALRFDTKEEAITYYELTK